MSNTLDPREVKTVDDARRIVEERDITHVKVGVFDIDGVLRGKYMSRDKFFSALEKGFGFCDVVLGWDIDDQLYDNVRFTGWHTGYPDAPVRLIPSSCRPLPFEGDMLFFQGEFAAHAETVGPRALLHRAVERCRGMGFVPHAAFEYEFFVFDETPHSLRDKGFRDLKPITPDNFGYSVIRNSVWAEFYHELLQTSEQMDFPLEGLHTETGPGVLEAAITVDEALDAADKAALFKTFSKVVAQRNDLMLTFMSKWSPDYPGQSGHIHVSLQRRSGKSAFFEAGTEHNMSTTMRHFLGGCQRLMPEMLALVANTVNAYSRLVPGAWAPTNATWGIENRTTALRVIPGYPSSQRIEYRVAGADANPYLALSAVLASGMYGIEHELEPTEPVEGNAYEHDNPPDLDLPETLWEAAQAFRASQVAREAFGDDFVEHYAATREWEQRQARRAITDWELERYFEII